MREYRWLLMDADNTLFDFNAAEEFALTRTLLHYGISPTEEAKASYHAINNALWAASDQGKITQQALMNERFVRFFEARGIQGNSAEWNQFFLEQLSQCSVLLPGAEALCRRLSQKYILALCTNSAAPFVARRRLENSPLARFFGDRVFISGEMGCHKPEKAYFDKVLETLGATKHKADVLVIGDSLTSDIRGAFNSRLDSVWLRWPTAKAGPVYPTYQVDNLAQLGELLENKKFPFTLR